MTETAVSVINDALQEILVQASEEPIEASEFQTGIRFLNRMMATTPYNGLGFVEVVNPNDRITVVPAGIAGMVSNLALKLAPQFDITPNQLLLQSAKDGLNEIRLLTVSTRATEFPNTLPIGSGNEWNNRGSGWVDPFFNPINFAEDAQDLKVNETDSFTVDFTLYLLSGATITAFTVTGDEFVSIISSSESNGFVTFSAKGLKRGAGKVCVDVTTSNLRVNPELVNINVDRGCNA